MKRFAVRQPAFISRFAPLLAVGLVLVFLSMSTLACSSSGDGKVIYITATPAYDDMGNLIIPPTPTSSSPTEPPTIPTPDPTRALPEATGEYMIQPGDTLGAIASLYNTTIETILAANNLENPNALEVGQVIIVPGGGVLFGPDFKLIPDSELVYSPGASDFSTAGTIKFRQGFLKAYSENVDGSLMSGAEIIDSIALAYSINPRLLLALLEYRGGWLTQPYPDEPQINYPMGIIKTGREGLYKQVWDAADALNFGYYGWKYRGRIAVTMSDNTRLFYGAGLNAGTVAVQYMLSLTASTAQWKRDVAPDGFFQTYLDLFGDPFSYAVEPLIPPNLEQPAITLPFAQGEEWVYTGGPHGAYNSGSAWAAIDLAPPKPPDDLFAAQGRCYISPNWVTAVAPGIVVRSGEGYVVLDLDGDGNEHTGWVMVYLHIDDRERIEAGTQVQAGDKLGHPSCQGGVSTGTHLHFSRRFNGEWIPAECQECAPGAIVPPFKVGEWTVFGLRNQEYQGYMTRAGDDGYRQADQTREYTQNKLIW